MHYNPDDSPELRKLKTAFDQHGNDITKLGVGKRECRDEETDRLRAAARAAGKSEKEVRKEHALTSPYFHYEPTKKQYRGTKDRFCEWLAEKHPEAKKIDYIHRKGYDKEWLQETYGGSGQNVGTMKTNRSQLAKYLGVNGEDIMKIEGKRPMPTKGRDFSPEYSPAADKKKFGADLIDLTRITSARDCEVGHINPSCFVRHADGLLYCHYNGKEQNTKGSRDRVSLILPENEKRIMELTAGLNSKTNIISNVPTNFKGHAYRRLYAADIYHHFMRPLDTLVGKRMAIKAKRDNARGTVRTTAPQIYHSTLRDEDYDRKAMEKVVECLGHGGHRCALVVKNYADYF